MNIVSVEKIAKTYGEKVLFTDLSFGISEGARIALIGVNGSGKSTLLQIVAGIVQPDLGQVVTRNGLTVEYLAQAPRFDEAATVLQTVFQGENPQIRTLRAYEEALEQLNERPEDQRLQSRLAELQTQMDAGGVWALEAQAKSILNKLGITGFNRLVGELSGGQRKRVAMARALIQPADLLILDEPTNHIDNETVAWLEEYLASYKGALLLITHDRYFLDRVVNQIVELDRGRLVSYEGNYGAYLEQKAEREVTEAAQETRRQNLLRRELHWLRQGAQARTTKQKARIQRAEKLIDERPEAKGGQVEIAVSAHRLGRRIIEVKDVSKTFEGRTVIENFSYNLLPGDRIGIIGPNGAGKSTLLNLIAGRLVPDAGEVLTGGTVRLAYYDQESSEMDPEQKVIDYIKDVAEVIKLPDGATISAAQMLERFLFPAKVQWTEIGMLSGGERRRLYLCRTLMKEPNVLLLDEPTNDLDIQTLTILEEFLDSFPGVVVAVSHDRYFLDRMAEHLFAFEGDGRIRHFMGDWSDYAAARAAERAELAAQGSATQGRGAGAPVSVEPAPRERQKQLKLSFKEQREWETIEERIAGLEAELAKIQSQMEKNATDYGKLAELTREQDRVSAELGTAMDRWAELAELVEAIQQAKAK